MGVASLSSLSPAITTGGGEIYGVAATGPGGTVSGDVGDGRWLSTTSGQQPGSVTDDFNMAVPDVALPSPWNPNFIPLPGVGSDGRTYTYALTAGDWQFNGNTSPGGNGILVRGKVRIFFNGDFKMSSGTVVRLEPGATLEIYMGGSMDLSGNCIVNTSKIAANCTIYGLNSCTSMKYRGTSEVYAKIYAPNATIDMGGEFDISGSIVGKIIKLSGEASFHYDEALNTNAGPDFRVVAWEEL